MRLTRDQLPIVWIELARRSAQVISVRGYGGEELHERVVTRLGGCRHRLGMLVVLLRYQIASVLILLLAFASKFWVEGDLQQVLSGAALVASLIVIVLQFREVRKTTSGAVVHFRPAADVVEEARKRRQTWEVSIGSTLFVGVILALITSALG